MRPLLRFPLTDVPAPAEHAIAAPRNVEPFSDEAARPALLLVADAKNTYLVSGNGDVIEPDDGIVAIGSGGSYALAAARALAKHTQLSARDIVLESMRLAGEICIFTNQEIVIEEL